MKKSRKNTLTKAIGMGVFIAAAVSAACSHSDGSTFRTSLGNKSFVRGEFEVRERAYYSVAIEAVLSKPGLATKEQAFAFLRYHDLSAQTLAKVSIRKFENNSFGEWAKLEVVNPQPSSWSSKIITTELGRFELDKGRYQLEVSISHKTYVDDSLISNLIVEHAYIGK